MSPRARQFGIAALLTFTLAGCNKSDVTKLSKVGEKTVEKIRDASAGARDRVTEGIESLQSPDGLPPVARRAQSRLQADSRLEGATISVIAKGGIIELRGAVRDQGQKSRAVELARTTSGVTEVVDSLSIALP